MLGPKTKRNDGMHCKSSHAVFAYYSLRVLPGVRVNINVEQIADE